MFYLRILTTRGRKAQSAAQLIRICGMLFKSQTKNSLSHAAVTMYFKWPVICTASGKCEMYLIPSIPVLRYAIGKVFFYECKS